jgi:heme A synthase
MPVRDPVAARRRYARYAWAVVAANLLVILWGAFVRASGSGAGCGSHWPLCNGEVVPRAPAVATLIEFGHRISSGVALVLIAGLVVGAWRVLPRRHPARFGAAASAFFIITEALIGAGLVLLEHVAQDRSVARAYWVGGHLVNTFLLVAALTLTARAAGADKPRRWRSDPARAVAIGVALAAVLLLGVSGAITALGDTLFPVASLAEGKALTFSPTAHLFVRLRIWHPALALFAGVCVAAAALAALRSPAGAQVRRACTALALLYPAQLALGLANVWLLAPIPVQLAHLLLSDLIWIALVLLAADALTVAPGTEMRVVALEDGDDAPPSRIPNAFTRGDGPIASIPNGGHARMRALREESDR